MIIAWTTENQMWREELRVTGKFFGTLWAMAGCTRFSMKSLRTLFTHLCEFCHEWSSIFCFLVMAEVYMKKKLTRECWYSMFLWFILFRIFFPCDFFLNTALNNWELLYRTRSRPSLWNSSTSFERWVHRIFYCLNTLEVSSQSLLRPGSSCMSK